MASFEIDQFVYFFFVEKAAEVDKNSCGEIRYPRVARVCKVGLSFEAFALDPFCWHII